MVEQSTEPSTPERNWRTYWDKTEGRPPRPTLLRALDAFEDEGRSPGLAVDLGCGTGRDAVELVRRGWRVVAVDGEAEALERLRAKVPPASVEPVLTSLASYTPPRCLLVNASFALFFLDRAALEACWRRIVASLAPGGRFAGQLLGPEDSWVTRGRCTGLARAELDALTAGWEVEMRDEAITDGVTPQGEAKHWHIWHVNARRPS